MIKTKLKKARKIALELPQNEREVLIDDLVASVTPEGPSYEEVLERIDLYKKGELQFFDEHEVLQELRADLSNHEIQTN